MSASSTPATWSVRAAKPASGSRPPASSVPFRSPAPRRFHLRSTNMQVRQQAKLWHWHSVWCQWPFRWWCFSCMRYWPKKWHGGDDVLLSMTVQKSFAAFTLSADIRVSGDRVGIFGTSGSGKSTLVSILAGLVEPDAGEIFLNGDCLGQ